MPKNAQFHIFKSLDKMFNNSACHTETIAKQLDFCYLSILCIVVNAGAHVCLLANQHDAYFLVNHNKNDTQKYSTKKHQKEKGTCTLHLFFSCTKTLFVPEGVAMAGLIKNSKQAKGITLNKLMIASSLR